MDTRGIQQDYVCLRLLAVHVWKRQGRLKEREYRWKESYVVMRVHRARLHISRQAADLNECPSFPNKSTCIIRHHYCFSQLHWDTSTHRRRNIHDRLSKLSEDGMQPLQPASPSPLHFHFCAELSWCSWRAHMHTCSQCTWITQIKHKKRCSLRNLNRT